MEEEVVWTSGSVKEIDWSNVDVATRLEIERLRRLWSSNQASAEDMAELHRLCKLVPWRIVSGDR
jgi:hypothetical protein